MKTLRRLSVLGLMVAVATSLVAAQHKPPVEPPSGPVYVSEPSVPSITPAVRDLPDWKPDPKLFGLEMKRRDDFGFLPVTYPITPKVDPLLDLSPPGGNKALDAFSSLIHNYAGQTSSASPPDTTGDVGPTYFVQVVNQSSGTVQILNKATGANVKTFTMQSLTTASPCRSGLGDGIALYDRAADRWMISELPGSGGNVCVYVSTTNDPTGTWYAYSFAVESSTTDYPKYGVWPQNGNAGSYLLGVNAGAGSSHDLFALDRAKMLLGQAASFQKFSVPNLPNSGFQLVLPSTMQGATPPPNGEPAIFIRPRDDEAQDNASTPSFDLLEMWSLTVDWSTPANSQLTQLTSLHIGDYDMTLCGLGGTWNCMPQPGTIQKIDPLREPLHFPLQYRNFGDRQTLVGTFPEDVDGTDHAALRWFEVRKTGAGAWSLYQEGLVGGESGVHRSIGSVAMDGSGNIALGYTRTGTSAPYYPSMYYKGRLATDAPGSMPQGEYVIVDATTSKTDNERWGDYAGIAVDPTDDCTFWFTSEYGGSGATKVSAFKFDSCGCASVPAPPVASASAPQDNRIDVAWNDSATASITQYLVYRSTVAGGPYTQLATVSDTSPGVGNGAGYVYHDDTVSGGTRYYYVVKSTDGVSCSSANSNEVNALATGQCRLAPTFGGATSVTNPGLTTCTLTVNWNAATSNCANPVTYNVYRSTTSGFTPAAGNRIASGVTGLSYVDAVGISNNTTYYYIVRAVDTLNGVEDGNTVQQFGSPSGPITTSGWTDTFEGSQSGGGFDQSGWAHNAINGSTNWVWSTAQKRDGTHSWFAADISTVSDKVLVSPAFGVGAPTTLSFWHTYSFEGGTGSSCFDAGTVEYTTNGGASWTVVPDADFTGGLFNGTVSTSYSNPIGGKRAWCGGTVGTMTQVALNLGADANLLNKTVQLRWHEGDDSSTSRTGWYVDSVTVTNAQVAGACTTGSGCTPPGAPSLTSATPDCGVVRLAWNAGSGTTSAYNVYRGTVSGGPYTKLAGPLTTTTYTDSTAAVGTTYYYVVAGACDVGGTSESPKSNQLSAALVTCTALDQCHTAGTCNTGTGLCSNPVKTDGSACNDTNACTTSDSCQAGTCVGANPVVCTALDQCHTAGACNAATGTCSNPSKNDGSACNDGNACTTTDACQGGACVGASPVTCTALDQCHDAGTCNSATGTCSNPTKTNGSACNDGNACTATDSCQAGACIGASPTICTALDQCHDAGACDTGTGLCSNPSKNDGSVCNDGNACTTTDACQAGACVGASPIVCAATDQCHDAGTCDPQTGVCSAPAKSNGVACTDGNPCLIGETCQGGTCGGGTPVPAPGITSGLMLDKSQLTWTSVVAATSYDIVRGTVSVLLPGGDYTSATDACDGSHVTGTSLAHAHVPPAGDADWFLVRASNTCGIGTYDEGSASQVGARDAAINAATNACP